MKNKLILFVLFSLFINFSLYSQSEMSDKDSAIINKTLDMRFSLRTINSTSKAIEIINNYKTNLSNDSDYLSASPAIKISVDNMICYALYNCLYDLNQKDEQLKPLMLNQWDKILEFQNSHSDAKENCWFVFTSGDVLNSTMQFLPQTKAMKLGLEEKADYDTTIQNNPDFSFGLINTGLWYYFAPAIGGGSNKKAEEYFKHAVETAATDYEKFYADIYYSQLLYENKDLSGAEKYLKAAETISKNCTYITFIKKINSINHSVLDYTLNREKIDKLLK